MSNRINGRTLIPIGLAFSILGVAVTGGIGWGSLQAEMKNTKDYIREQSEQNKGIRRDVNRLSREQGVMKEKVDNLDEKQEQFRKDTKDSLGRILDSLNRR